MERVRVPLGVVGIIYESRPNVTADAGALAVMAGNAVILRGGSEARESNAAIQRCMVAGMAAAGAVKLAAARRAPAEPKQELLRLIDAGFAIASGTDTWEGS